MSSRSPSPPDELYVPPVDSTDDELIDDFYDTQDDLDDELDEDIDMDPEDILLRALIQAEARERTPIDQDSEDEDSVSGVEEDPAVVRLLSTLRESVQNTEIGPGIIAQLRALVSNPTSSNSSLLLNNLFGTVVDADEYDETDEDDDAEEDDAYFHYGDPDVTSKTFGKPIDPSEKGLALRFGGEFGEVGRASRKKEGMGALVWGKGRALGKIEKARFGKECIPNTAGTVVANLTAPPYCGQYSSNSDFFYTATQDFKITLFSTTFPSTTNGPLARPAPPSIDPIRFRRYQLRGYGYPDDDDDIDGGVRGRSGESSLEIVKKFNGVGGGWTITDVDLGANDEWMAYSSMCPTVQLFRPLDPDTEIESLDFGSDTSSNGIRRRGSYVRIWSVRFSADGKEIFAGASGEYQGDGKIVVYDIEAKRPTLSIHAHQDDVNSVCWADKDSKHLLCSSSDDGYVKIWDRRSLSSGKPSGVLVGHTEGITSVSAKGDGRYIISNGKDQTLKLWDLRSMASASVCDDIPDAVSAFGTGWDYRKGAYPRPRFESARGDCSVMTYRGHSVVRTLIRCHFSPDAVTGQQYIYSGSADGRVHIWNLDGRVAQVLDRCLSSPLVDVTQEGYYTDPSGADLHSTAHQVVGNRSTAHCVRDVSWHPYKPEMMSSAWDPSFGGTVAKHEWKGYGKHGMTINDVVQREKDELTF